MKLKDKTIHLHPDDNVAIVKEALQPGMEILIDLASNQQVELTVKEPVPSGHKVALIQRKPGEAVRRYGEVIGSATVLIQPGEHIHSHNLAIPEQFDGTVRETTPQMTTPLPKAAQRKFLGFLRPDGKVGTRNYIAVISTVNCSAFVCRQIAAYFTAERLAAYPNIDGVIALTHGDGCGRAEYSYLQRTLAGMAQHPNVGGSVTVGLGCEGNQAAILARDFGLPDPALPIHPGESAALVIQDLGGSAATIQAGIAAVENLLPRVNAVERSPQPISKLRLGLECGGSDSWSGITANPLVGRLADELVRQGGGVVISETAEVFGAQHLLAGRAINPQVGQKLLDKIAWWRDYLKRMGSDFDDNPGPGNRAGGLSNICEKSLGAITKGGSTALMAVYDYAQAIDSPGLVFMDTPGYDPPSLTGMAAGGCNLILFTTGRGSVAGFKPAPVVKICTNSQTYERMSGDMDFNAGTILDGSADFPTSTAALFDLVVDVASGRPSKSEALGMGEVEFVPWNPFGIV